MINKESDLKESYSTSFVVEAEPKDVFNAINNVRGWWSEDIDGQTDKNGEIFEYNAFDIHHCKIELIEFVPEKKVVWLILENYFKNPDYMNEWDKTQIFFEISKIGTKTKIKFTHYGLTPQLACFDLCSHEWYHYMNSSLKNLITIGKGQPHK